MCERDGINVAQGEGRDKGDIFGREKMAEGKNRNYTAKENPRLEESSSSKLWLAEKRFPLEFEAASFQQVAKFLASRALLERDKGFWAGGTGEREKRRGRSFWQCDSSRRLHSPPTKTEIPQSAVKNFPPVSLLKQDFRLAVVSERGGENLHKNALNGATFAASFERESDCVFVAFARAVGPKGSIDVSVSANTNLSPLLLRSAQQPLLSLPRGAQKRRHM